jgi:hypothetical protein
MSKQQREQKGSNVEHSSTQPVKSIFLIFGMPALVIILATMLSVAFSYYVYPALFTCLIISCVAAYIWRKVLSSSYPLILSINVGGPIDHKVMIRGVPINALEQIRETVEKNRLVVLTLPKDNFLRIAFNQKIYQMGGFVEFKTGHTFALSDKPLGKRILLLSHRSKAQLQCAISHLLQRGWQLYGDQGTESSLVDRVYTQSMLYDPGSE